MFINAARFAFSRIHYPTMWAVGSAALCVTVTAQIAYRLFTQLRNPTQVAASWWIQREVARMTFFSLCALNIVPYTAVLRAATFLVHSYYSILFKKDTYDLSILIAFCSKEAGQAIYNYFKDTPSIIFLEEKETWIAVAA